MNKNDFANFVKNKRKELGMTQEELAAQLNVSRDVVSKWESGKRYPDMETSQKLAFIFGVTPNEMYDQSSVNDSSPLINSTYIIAPIVGLLLIIGFILIPLATHRDNIITPVDKLAPQYYMDMKSAASDDRYYFINDGALVYYDKNKSDIKYLCKKENCEHVDESCDARAIVFNTAPKAVWYYNDRLYMIARGAERTIVSYNLDGEDKKTHTKLNVDSLNADGSGKYGVYGSDIYAQDTAYAMCFNEGYVYYLVRNIEAMQLYRVSVESGSTPELLASYDLSRFGYGFEVTLTAMPKMVYVNILLGSASQKNKTYTYILDYYDVANNEYVKVLETDSEKNSEIASWGRRSDKKSCVFDDAGNMYYVTVKDNEYIINKLNVRTKEQEKFYSINRSSDAEYVSLQMFDGTYFYITRGNNYMEVLDKEGKCVASKEIQIADNETLDLLVGNANRFIMNYSTLDMQTYTTTNCLYDGSVVDSSLSVNKVGK